MCSRWSATCASVAFGVRAAHTLVDSATLVASTPAARNARARASILSSYTRTASDTKPGLKFTMTMPPFAGTSLRIESGTSRAWPVSARADEWENITGARVAWSASDIVASFTWERSTTIPSRFISCTTSRPNAERPQRAERILDGVATFDADQAGDLPRCEVSLDVRGPIRHRDVARILGTQPLDQVDLLERVHRRMGPGVHGRNGHVRRPELRSHAARAPLRGLGHELRLQHGEVHGVEPATGANGVGDVVVAVDQRDRLEEAQRLGAEILGGQADRRTGGQQEQGEDQTLCHLLSRLNGRRKAGAAPRGYQDYVSDPCPLLKPRQRSRST